jgi:hypothetical protein
MQRRRFYVAVIVSLVLFGYGIWEVRNAVIALKQFGALGLRCLSGRRCLGQGRGVPCRGRMRTLRFARRAID